MDWLVKLLFCTSLLVYNISAQTWDDPFISEPNNGEVTITESSGIFTIKVNEENPGISIGILEYIGASTDITFRSDEGDHLELGLESQCVGTTKCELIANNRMDFEQGLRPTYMLFVKIKDVEKRLMIYIINIDDNPTLMSLDGNDGCKVNEEHTGGTATACKYTVSDADGMLGDTSFEVVVDDGQEDYGLKFEFKLDESNIPEAALNTKATLFIQQGIVLLYEERSLYIFNLLISKETESENSFRVLIEVNDIPNKPPIWSTIKNIYQFPEHQIQSIEIKAIDGDITIDAPIDYKIESLDAQWESLIKIEDPQVGLITVGDIDRDISYFDTTSAIPFILVAYERNDPDNWKTKPFDISFIIDDIDDQIPEITVEMDTFKICERSNVVADRILKISDVDLGENARYNVELEDNEFSKAFKIVPTSGYQKLDFLLPVEQSDLLDYENPAWISFSFKVNSMGTTGTNSDSKDIKIELINWNDEVPQFTEPGGYTADVDETIGANSPVATVEASDRDGFGLTYSLPVGMQSILEISPEGVIKTKVDNVFDFERQEVLLIFVTATDIFDEDQGSCNPKGETEPNRETVTVTVNIKDINDERPVLNAIINEDITIQENSAAGTEVDISASVIEATDADKVAVLSFEIDWENSRATKLGARLNAGNFEAHVKGFLDVETDTASHVGKAVPKFKIVDKYPETPESTPDYEQFDTVVLRLKITDTDQTIMPNSATADITILIGDLNDNAPVFDTISLDIRPVAENSVHGTTLGRVLATDKDGPGNNQVTYSLVPKAPTPDDKLTIDPSTGELTVQNTSPPDTNIDCDPDIVSLTYTVTATDNHGQSQSADIEINMIDINDVPPVLTVNTEIIEMLETEPTDTAVDAGISVFDGDRDRPHNVVKYRLSTTEAANYFKIDIDNGKVTIDQEIDRDKDLFTNPIIVTISVMDNDGFNGLSDDKNIRVRILDRNDNGPKVQNLQLAGTENNRPGANTERVDSIQIFDADEGDTANSAIDNIAIISVMSGTEILDGFFGFSDPVQTGQLSTVNLIALKSLEGYHGLVDIKIKVTDKGDQSEGTAPEETTLALIVDKFNFKPPVFEFPTANEYSLNMVLPGTSAQLPNGDEFGDIKANDQQNGKYPVDITITDPTGIFAFANGATATSPAKLIIKGTPVELDDYTVIFEAVNRDANPPETSATSKTVTFRFVDPNAQPTFTDNTQDLKIPENDPKATVTFNEAKYDAEVELTIYYIIMDATDLPFHLSSNIQRQLVIDEENYPEGVDREAEDGEQYTVRILASRSPTPPAQPSANSILTLTVLIDDRNDNEPAFEEATYYAPLINTLTPNSRIFTASAYDLDKTDVLSFKFTKCQAFGDGACDPDPFKTMKISNDVEIQLNFAVNINMDGYFILELSVMDSLDGEIHTNTASVQIYIVSDLHRVDFKFVNTIAEVTDRLHDVKEILSEIFEYQCMDEKINSDPEEASLTVLSVHFVDLKEHQAILKNTIIEIASVITVISKMKLEFNNIGLTLDTFVDNFIIPEDLSEYYKTWLIGVAVVMGVLIAFIFVASTFKYIGMRKQIARLTNRKFGSADSGLNRIAAPNTNNHTFDGANPVFYNETKPEMPDTVSISSGDSELIGVENNPVFSNHVEKY